MTGPASPSGNSPLLGTGLGLGHSILIGYEAGNRLPPGAGVDPPGLPTLSGCASPVTALVTRLTGAGLVAKRAHPREHRAVVLQLTDEGDAALCAARPEIDRFNGELRALLGDQGFTQTAAALERLAQAEWDDRPGIGLTHDA